MLKDKNKLVEKAQQSPSQNLGQRTQSNFKKKKEKEKKKDKVLSPAA